MQYLVSISGGAASTLALHRCLAEHGAASTLAVFADTGTEDPSLYRLLDAIPEIACIDVVRLGGDRTIWDVFDDAGIIRTPTGACKASLELKQKPLAAYVSARWAPGEVTIVSGLEHTEDDRIRRFDARWHPYECWHPLMDRPWLSDCQIVAEVERLGYPSQDLYEHRYPHNNCAGGCILAGLGQWAGLYQDYPERFRWHQGRERQFNATRRQGKRPFAVLRDQSAKPTRLPSGEVVFKRKVTPLTLDEFEERLLTNDIDVRDFRSTCGCMLGEQGSLFDQL